MFSWYRYCLRHYCSIKGRASRAEYWSFTLINIVIILILTYLSGNAIVDSNLMDPDISTTVPNPTATESTFSVIYAIFCLLILLPSFAATVRRLHDRDHTGWWVIANFVPILNFVLLIILLLGSQPQPNKYGLRAPQNPGDVVPDLPYGYYNQYGQGPQGGYPPNYPQNNNLPPPPPPRQAPVAAYPNNVPPTPAAPNAEAGRHRSVVEEMLEEENGQGITPPAPPQASPPAPPQEPEAGNPQTLAGSTHRPMTPGESSMIDRLKRMSGQDS